jgi:hypothetical protein
MPYHLATPASIVLYMTGGAFYQPYIALFLVNFLSLRRQDHQGLCLNSGRYYIGVSPFEQVKLKDIFR